MEDRALMTRRSAFGNFIMSASAFIGVDKESVGNCGDDVVKGYGRIWSHSVDYSLSWNIRVSIYGRSGAFGALDVDFALQLGK